MTNPNNAIGTNGAFGGRTSVNAFNDVMGALSRGVLSGWACAPNSGLTVSLGGNGTTRDTAIAEDNAGNKTSINNISNSPVNVTIGAAPGTNSRIDAIVAYVDNPPSGTSTVTDNPGACGLIVVEGNTASSPVAPNDSKIRTAITADGASGTTAYYVILAYITMTSGTTDITSNEITAGPVSVIGNNMVQTSAIADNSVTNDKIDFSTMIGSDSVPVATTDLTVEGFTGVLTRVGNMVSCSGTAVVNSFPSGNRQSTSVTVPLGFRAVQAIEGLVMGNCLDGQFSAGQPITLAIDHNGSVLRSSSILITGATRVDYVGAWVTSDPWPSN